MPVWPQPRCSRRPWPAQDFYAGKTIDFIVGHYVGGGYDIYARAVARHMGAAHPRQSGDRRARTCRAPAAPRPGCIITNTAAKDGTAIGARDAGRDHVGPLLDGKPELDCSTRPGSTTSAPPINGTRVCVTLKEAAAQSFADMLKTKDGDRRRGASNDATHDYAYMVKNVTGAQLTVVTGYKGTSDIGLAMERREVDGSCGWDWASFKSQRAALDQGRPDQRACCRSGTNPNEELTQAGRAADLGRSSSNDDDRKAVELITSQQVFHRSYIAPPGNAGGAACHAAHSLHGTMKDPKFQADAQKTAHRRRPLLDGAQDPGLDRPKLAATPEAVVQRARRAIRP